MTYLTDEERDYIRDLIQSLNPGEDLMGAMLSKTDVVRRFRNHNVYETNESGEKVGSNLSASRAG